MPWLPAAITKVIVDEEKDQMTVVVAEDQLSLAIGRRGQNVRLASQLTGWIIELLTEEQESASRQEDFQKRSAFFTEALDVDDMIAQLLAAEGFVDLEQIAETSPVDLAQIEGFDEGLAEELCTRAQQWLDEQIRGWIEKRRAAGVTDEVAETEGLTHAMVALLGDAGVLTLDDLAGLSRDDLADALGSIAPPVDELDRIILTARQRWYPDESLLPEESEEEVVETPSAVSEELRAAEAVFAAPEAASDTSESETAKEGNA